MTVALVILLAADVVYGRPGLVKPCDELAYLPLDVQMPPPMAAMLFIGPPPPPKLQPLPVAPGTNQYRMMRRAELVQRAIQNSEDNYREQIRRLE